jgi:predicted ATP-dependent Lon-type protease
MERWVLVTENYLNEVLETLSKRPYNEVATIFAKLASNVKQYDAPAVEGSQDVKTEE